MTYDDLLGDVQKEFPGFKVEQKTKSWLMIVISYLLFFNRDFMTNFITTIGSTMYVPDAWYTWHDNLKSEVLRHERVHLLQQKRYGMLLYSLLYLLIPLPFGLAWYRAQLEWEAYQETMRCIAEEYGVEMLRNPSFKENMLDHFTTGQYGWMWPFRSQVNKWYDDFVAVLEKDAISK